MASIYRDYTNRTYVIRQENSTIHITDEEIVGGKNINKTYFTGKTALRFAYNLDDIIIRATTTSTTTNVYPGQQYVETGTGRAYTYTGTDWANTDSMYYSSVKTYEEKIEFDGNYNIYMEDSYRTFSAKDDCITEDDLEGYLESIRREKWIKTLREKRIEIKIKKAENRGLTLLEKLADEEQVENYKNKGFVDIQDLNGNICRIYGDDSRKIDIFEKKQKIIIANDLSTIDKLNKMDEFILNGESFVMTKRICTHHKAQNMPNVDGVISKIAWLRSGQEYEKFGNIYKVA